MDIDNQISIRSKWLEKEREAEEKTPSAGMW